MLNQDMSSRENAAANPISVLIVEDNESFRDALKALLEIVGYRVTAAGTVAEAVALFDSQEIALLDFNLPDGLGSGVMRHIREKRPLTRVAFLTSDPDNDRLASFKADAVFLKTGNTKLLIDWMREAKTSRL